LKHGGYGLQLLLLPVCVYGRLNELRQQKANLVIVVCRHDCLAALRRVADCSFLSLNSTQSLYTYSSLICIYTPRGHLLQPLKYANRGVRVLTADFDPHQSADRCSSLLVSVYVCV